MRILICIVISSFLISCNINEKANVKLVRGKVIIEGKVQNFANGSQVLRFAAISVIEDIEQIAILDSLGNFRTEFELFNPQDVSLFYENLLATLYLNPGDSLFISIDANLIKIDDSPHYEVSGKNSATSQNIRDYIKYRNSLFFEPNFEKSFDEFLSDVKKQMVRDDSVLQKFYHQNKPEEEFMTWAKKNIIYNNFNSLVNYFMYYDINYNQYKTEILNTGLFPFDDDSAVTNSLYIQTLSNYPWLKYKGDSIFTKLYQEKDYKTIYAGILNKLVNNENPGLSRDIIICKMLSDIFNKRFKGSIDDADTLLENYKIYINDRELLTSLIEKKSIFKNQETILNLKLKSESEITIKFFEMLIIKHKDKVIYVDIWATWCGPCRREIPYAIDLHNYFDNKSVAFVYLCLESNKDDWEKIISKDYSKGDNYFFNKEESMLLRNELKFNGFPTYMIIDKKGEWISKNAPRPSSGDEIRNLLSKLL